MLLLMPRRSATDFPLFFVANIRESFFLFPFVIRIIILTRVLLTRLILLYGLPVNVWCPCQLRRVGRLFHGDPDLLIRRICIPFPDIPLKVKSKDSTSLLLKQCLENPWGWVSILLTIRRCLGRHAFIHSLPSLLTRIAISYFLTKPLVENHFNSSTFFFSPWLGCGDYLGGDLNISPFPWETGRENLVSFWL